ncbi:MAG: Uma2 family endonuclease [Verrucomicrobiales bacterium]
MVGFLKNGDKFSFDPSGLPNYSFRMVSLKSAPSENRPRDKFASRFDYVPPLENGDRLSATEFLRRYDAMPEQKKAELIQGIVYMASPVYAEQHGDPDSFAQGWLFNYAAQTRGVKSSTNTTIRLGPDDTPQPDACLRILPEFGGRCRIEGQILSAAPELIFEVAASSASIDSNAKKTSYLRAGVQEYVLWRTLDGEIDWWKLEEDEFRLIESDEDGILRSEAFPGLWLDREAMLDEDAAKVLAVLNQGLANEAHEAFVVKLAANAS